MTERKNQFIIITENQPWLLNKEIVTNYSKKVKFNENIKENKKENKSQIQNEIFMEISKISQDEYWKSIFVDAAYGKFPQDVQYKNDSLFYKNKNKTYVQEIDKENLEKTEKDIISFFNNTVKLYSFDDISNRKNELDEKLKENSNSEINSWKQIKKFNNKMILMRKFINKYISTNKVNDLQKQNLENVIAVGLLSKSLNANNIIVECGIIKEITSLARKENGFFYINNDEVKKTKSRKTKDEDDEDINTIFSHTTKELITSLNKEKVANINFNKEWRDFISSKQKKRLKYVK